MDIPAWAIAVLVVGLFVAAASLRNDRSENWGSCGVWGILFIIAIAGMVIYAVLTTPEHWGTNPINPDSPLYPFVMGGK